ncbi:MAG: hypothetical protein ACOC8F_02940, partial [Planctomycetota bacterium]
MGERLRRVFVAAVGLAGSCGILGCASFAGRVPSLTVARTGQTPAWAQKQRELLELNARAVKLWAQAYLLPNGWVNVEYMHGAGVVAPDDLMETTFKMPLLYALGAEQVTWDVWWKIWRGHLDQCEQMGVFERGMPSLDWHHNGEHYHPFWLAALCVPNDPEYRRQALRYASYFDGTDPEVPNYDPENKVMRSMLSGGSGPILEPTREHWDPRGGAAWDSWLDCVHDNPINLVTTCFGTNAFMLTGDERHRRVVVEYIDAWRRRAEANDGIVPSIALADGTVPEQWWGGVMGWAFGDTRYGGRYAFGGVFQVSSGPRAAWANALLLTGDASYYDTMRTLADELWGHRFYDEKGRVDLPSERVADGWSGSQRRHRGGQRLGVYATMLANIYLATMSEEDLQRVLERRDAQGYAGHARPFYESGNEPEWIAWLGGENPGWHERALDEGISTVSDQLVYLAEEADRGPEVERVIATEPPWTVGHVGPLVNLMTGGVLPLWHGQLHLARFRYFDPESQRPGIPPDVAALVESMSDTGAALVLVNTSRTDSRRVLVQAGAYAEHQFQTVRVEGKPALAVDGTLFEVELAPRATARLDVRM